MEIKLGLVTGREDKVSRGRTVPARLMQVMLTDESDIQTVQLVGQNGEECNPPDGSLVLVVQAGTAYKLAIGTEDTIAPVMGVGGKRIYSTDSDSEAVTASVRLDPDGLITVSNGGGSITLTPAGLLTVTCDGNTVINSAKTIINNNVEIDGTLLVSGITTLNNNVEIDGTLLVSDTITGQSAINATGNVSSGSITLTTHKHGGVATGGGQSGVAV